MHDLGSALLTLVSQPSAINVPSNNHSVHQRLVHSMIFFRSSF